jgi:hypothetical protein
MASYPTVEVGWPFVVLSIAFLLRDELRWWRANRSATAVRQAVDKSTLVVRRGDELPHAHRRRASDRIEPDDDTPQDL